MSEREILITEPGFYLGIAPRQYFAEPCPAPAFSNSMSRILLDETPLDAAYRHPALGQPRDELDSTVAKRLGDVTHQLTLDKGVGYAVRDCKAWASDNDKAFKQAAIDAGLTPLKKHEFDAAEAMAAILKPMIAETLAGIARERGIDVPAGGIPYQTEVVFAWQEDIDVGDGEVVTIWCRGMLDVWCELLLVALDPKVTAYLTESKAPAHMGNLGWDDQAALYTRGIEKLLPYAAGRVTFVDLMIKPKPPHTHVARAIDKGWFSTCNMDLDRAMVIFARCLRDGSWPGYAPGIHYMSQPSWAAKKSLDAAMAEAVEDGEG